MSFRIDPRLALTAEVRRIAGGEIDKIVAHLNIARDNPEKSLHSARKRIKALRALLRLVTRATKRSAAPKTTATATSRCRSPARARRRR